MQIVKFLLLFISFFLIRTAVAQTVSFDFEVSDGSYNNTDYGDWYAANSMTYGSGKQHAGSKALVFDDDAGAYLLYEGSDGNGKDGGIGDVTFYYRHWDADGHTVKFKVQYNKAGAGWVDIGSEVTVSSTTYTQYSETVNVGGDDILFRILSTSYQERCLIDDIVISGYGGSSTSSFTMADDGLINESLENNEVITVVLSSDTFVATLNSANWTITNQPDGVSIGVVNRINDTTATLTLSGNRTKDYDTDITDFTIAIGSDELQNLSSGNISASSGVTFTANNDAESFTMADDGLITEGSEDGEVVTVSLTGGTFAATINQSNWDFANIPTGVSIGSITRTNDTTLSIALSGNATADYDADITDGTLSCDAAEVDDTNADLLQNTGVTFTAVIEPKPTVQATDIVFSSVGASSISLSWTSGNGENAIVVARESQAVTAYPADGQEYNADSDFGNGDDLGTLEYVVYSGSSNSVTVNSLSQGKEYFFRVYEYNNLSTNAKYDTAAATGNPASTYTKPNDVTDFTLECISKTSAYLTWTPPTGSYDSIIIAARQSTNSVHTLSGNGSSYSADNTFGSGTAFGSTTPNSYVVYKGIGNSVNVVGLTPGSNYTFKAIVYKGNLWSSGKNKAAQIAEIKEVTDLQHYAPNQKIVLNWSNPDFNCPDEVMVVVRKDSAVTTNPSGDGSSYSADAVFGNGTDMGSLEYVVYKGTDDGVTITGLTNGETYYFTIFVRDGSSWSNGVQGSDTPNDISILFQGDLAVLAINTDNSSHDDEISLICFDTLKTGSSIDFTDNGWEREYSNYWGSTEGVIRFTRTGPDILPGQVFTFIGTGHQSSDFTATGLSDNSWSVSSLNGNYDFNLNGTDQIWILQYGTWTNGSSNHKATYSGNVLYGWTATGWAGDPGHGAHGTTKYSALYPAGECFNTNVVNTTNNSKVKYTGPTTSATQREWISRINDKDNWTGYADNASFDAGLPIYTAGDTLDIALSSYSDGEWIGDADSNWFNCGNWSDLAVPDEDKNVVISANAKRKCLISAQAENSDDFNDTASCKNLTISDSTLYLSSDDDILNIHGDLTINSGYLLPDSGQILISGNWTDNSATAFQKGSSSVIFNGNAQQTISSAGTEYFHKLVLNNSYNLNLSSSIEASHFEFTAGKLLLNSNNITITDSITGYSSSRYIIAEDDKASTGYAILPTSTTELFVPIGNTSTYNPVKISLTSGSASFKFRVFTNVLENGLTGNVLTGDYVDKTWEIEPLISGSITANITLQWSSSSELGDFGSNHGDAKMMFNDNTGSGTAWQDWNLLGGSGAVNGLNPFTLKASSISNFGSFGIGASCTINKPYTSNIYHY
jgi:hypothetical protein